MTDLLQQEITGPPVTVMIAGQEYPLAYPMAAACAYKQATGKSMFDPQESASLSLRTDPDRWLALLWAGLHQEVSAGNWTAPVTLQDLRRLRIADADLAKLDAAVWAAFRPSQPARKERKETADPNAGAPGEPAPLAVFAVKPATIENAESTGSMPVHVDVSD